MEKERRKQKMLEYIEDYTALKCCPPSIREIQAKLKVKSTSTIYGDLMELCDEGKLNKIEGHSNKFAPKYSETFCAKVRKHLKY